MVGDVPVDWEVSVIILYILIYVVQCHLKNNICRKFDKVPILRFIFRPYHKMMMNAIFFINDVYRRMTLFLASTADALLFPYRRKQSAYLVIYKNMLLINKQKRKNYKTTNITTPGSQSHFWMSLYMQLYHPRWCSPPVSISPCRCCKHIYKSMHMIFSVSIGRRETWRIGTSDERGG